MKIILTLALLCLCLPLRAQEKGGIVWSETDLRLGTVPLKETASRMVRYSNRGSKPVVIGKVDYTCGCIQVNFRQTPLLPGGTDSLEVSYRGQEKGVFYKTITVLWSNGTANEISVSGNVAGKREY